jgi:hypothetical protein
MDLWLKCYLQTLQFQIMPNTPLLKDCLKKITSLSDQLWYYFFLTENLNLSLGSFSEKAKEGFTTDLFSSNNYSKRIHVKAKNIPIFQDENKNLTCGAYFATCYEILAKYIEEGITFLGTCQQLNLKYSKSEDPEAALNRMFATEFKTNLPEYILDTLKYLRLRRNHYTHISFSPSQNLQKFLNERSDSLNSKWYPNGHLNKLDFGKPLMRDFAEIETIELLKVSRIVCTSIDQFIVSLIEPEKLIRFLVIREFSTSNKRVNSIILEQRIKKN